MEDFKKLFDSFSSLKVGVIGDVMLNTYKVSRRSMLTETAGYADISLPEICDICGVFDLRNLRETLPK